MSGGQIREGSEVFTPTALSTSSLKSKINLIHSKMSNRKNYPGDRGNVCENCRCVPPSKLACSRTVRRILAACLISLVTLLGSVSIEFSSCMKEWRNTEAALYGLSSCPSLIAMTFIGFLQEQRKLCCLDDLNSTDREILLIGNIHMFCKRTLELHKQSKRCEGTKDLNHTCRLYTNKIITRLENVADSEFDEIFSAVINDVLNDFSNPAEDLKIAPNNPDWSDIQSLHLLIRAKEAISEIDNSPPLSSDALQTKLYHVATMLNYALYTSDTLNSCWKDSNLSSYLTLYQNISIFVSFTGTTSMFCNPSLASDLNSVQDCLHQNAYEKLSNKSKEILSKISLKVTLLVVACLIYPVVLLSFKQMTEWIQNYARSLKERTEDLKQQRKIAEDLLHQMLPKSVAKQLRKHKHVEAESYDQVTIFFSDIVGFTSISASCTPLQVVEMLNSLYVCFDSRIESYNVYKVETIGDAYMVVSGLPERNNNKHADEIAKMSLDLVAAVRQVIIPHMPKERLKLRAGIHTGPCVAGVVGYKMPRYCLFGDTVNTASRMESTSLPQKIHISSATYQVLLIDDAYEIELRGEIEVKGKGKMKTYWLLGNKNYSVQNDSLVCHWNPEISRRKKLENSMGSVQQSLSSNMQSETSRVNTPRIQEELLAQDPLKGSQGLTIKVEESTCGPEEPGQKNRHLQENTKNVDSFVTLELPVSQRTEFETYKKDTMEKRIALPGFVEES